MHAVVMKMEGADLYFVVDRHSGAELHKLSASRFAMEKFAEGYNLGSGYTYNGKRYCAQCGRVTVERTVWPAVPPPEANPGIRMQAKES